MQKLPKFPVEGGCICGAVRYRLNAAPLGIYNCHCKDCQRSAGSAYSASMVVRREDFEVIAGETMTYDKRADSGRFVRADDAEDAALLAQLVAVHINERMGDVHESLEGSPTARPQWGFRAKITSRLRRLPFSGRTGDVEPKCGRIWKLR